MAQLLVIGIFAVEYRRQTEPTSTHQVDRYVDSSSDDDELKHHHSSGIVNHESGREC